MGTSLVISGQELLGFLFLCQMEGDFDDQQSFNPWSFEPCTAVAGYAPCKAKPYKKIRL